jgi:hypothetical protein
MERGVGKPPFFDGTNYSYWKIHMSAYLQSISYRVWEIFLDVIFDSTSDRIIPIQMEFHDSNNKARNTLFSCLSLGEFERVGHQTMAHQIWSTLERFHEGNDRVKNVAPHRTHKFDGHVAPSNLTLRTWVSSNLWEKIRQPPSNLKTHVLNVKFDGTHVLNVKFDGASLSSSKNCRRLYSSVNPRSYGKFDGLLH